MGLHCILLDATVYMSVSMSVHLCVCLLAVHLSLASFGNPQLWRDAISQNAFDTSAGAGIFLVYATYMKRSHGVMKMGILAPLANNCIRSVCLFGQFHGGVCFICTYRCNYSKCMSFFLLHGFCPSSVGSLVCGIMTFSTVFSGKLLQGKPLSDIVETLQNSGPANTGITFIW